MRTLSTLLVAATLSGCLIESNWRGYISASWQLRTAAGQPVSCIPGEVVTLSAAGTSYDFPCDQYGGTTGLVPTGSYTATITFYPKDGGSGVVISLPVNVYRGAVTDLGLITFTTQPPAPTGSATFTWSLHPYSASAPGQQCQPGESIYFEISGQPPFYTDCYMYSAQPIDNLAPGNYTARLSLIYQGNVEPGIATVIDTTFTVAAGANTPVHVDFIVESGPGRDVPAR